MDAMRMDDSEATEDALEGKTVATPDRIRFFQNTTASTEFLKVDLAEWEMAVVRHVHGLRVVKYFAERGFALIQAYNESTTKVEDKMQFRNI